MSRPNLLRRLALKALNWVLGDAGETIGHPVHTALYRATAQGRNFDRFVHPQLTVGEFTYGIRRDSFPFYHPADRVEIGRFCSIADDVRFIFGEHRTDAVSTFPFEAVCFGGLPHADARSKGPITVGHDVWIGAQATILSGVTIGHGAIIAAGAVVTRNVAPYAVVGGVPARLIRTRFKTDEIDALLALHWWDWPLEKIRENLELLQGPPAELIARHGIPLPPGATR